MRFYRSLLHLYPSSFRAEYRAEMERAFAERTEGRGTVAVMGAALADVVPNAIAAHVELLTQDLRYTAKSLRRAPGFALTAILVVALGVGANTAAFALANFIFFKPFPYAEPDRLVKLYEADRTNESDYGDISPGNFRDWKHDQHSFSAMGAYTFRSVNLVSDAEPRRVEMVRTTPDVLPMLGVKPVLGRLFSPEDTLSGRAVILSRALWLSQFGGDSAVVGKVIRLDGDPHVVVGVMPGTFQFPQPGIEAWAPFVLREADFVDRSDRYTFGIARLKPGLTRAQAKADLMQIAARLEKQFPQENNRTGAAVFDLRTEISGRSKALVFSLCGAALSILLLACANLASLFVARGADRARELAVRTALGAGRERLARQLITESLAVAVVGGIAGIGLAIVTLPLLTKLIPAGLPVASAPTLDARVLLAAFAFMLVTGLAFGLLPALRAGSNGAVPLDALRGTSRAGGGRTQRTRSVLVTIEVAASVVTLIVSGLLLRAVWRVQSIDPGFAAEHVLTVQTSLPLPAYNVTMKRVLFYQRVLDDVRGLPGVQSAAYTTGLPLQMRGGLRGITIPGREPPKGNLPTVSFRYATADFFRTLGIPFRAGRDFTSTDTRQSVPVAIVSESFVKKHWPGEDALGKQFRMNDENRTIVGVVGDIHVRGLERASEPQTYVPPTQVDDSATTSYAPRFLVVRTSGDPKALVPGIREIVHRADPEQPVSNVRALSDIVADETAPRRVQLAALVALSVIALLIAGLGVHGLVTFTVTRREREIGVRRALGARVGGVVRMVLREGLVLAVIGVALGTGAAYLIARGMRAALFGVQPNDPATIITAALLCLVAAIIGCVRPAISAARIDPASALRAE
ncbi:MAG TPA: ABC transporter permease [Gemmatimonadaceae bacterium]|nr:ABC transporter permease [Gemmatimonadaceae bacterium]